MQNFSTKAPKNNTGTWFVNTTVVVSREYTHSSKNPYWCIKRDLLSNMGSLKSLNQVMNVKCGLREF